MSETETTPAHLDPSELGTKEYWDDYYQKDLDNIVDNEEALTDPSELESWFDDVNAPAKILKFLTSSSFPLSPSAASSTSVPPSVLDLGTGNGSSLMSLRIDGSYAGQMVGIDYSQHSVDLASRLWKQYSSQAGLDHGSQSSHNMQQPPKDIEFHIADLLYDDLLEQTWWPSNTDGFNLVLDKGTFDAISLSSEMITDSDGRQKRVFEIYPIKILGLIAPGGFLLITSCNWTEAEVIKWFTVPVVKGRSLEVFETINYPSYQFGGQKGQGVATVCFRCT